jgi:hypothetical protein
LREAESQHSCVNFYVLSHIAATVTYLWDVLSGALLLGNGYNSSSFTDKGSGSSPRQVVLLSRWLGVVAPRGHPAAFVSLITKSTEDLSDE